MTLDTVKILAFKIVEYKTFYNYCCINSWKIGRLIKNHISTKYLNIFKYNSYMYCT